MLPPIRAFYSALCSLNGLSGLAALMGVLGVGDVRSFHCGREDQAVSGAFYGLFASSRISPYYCPDSLWAIPPLFRCLRHLGLAAAWPVPVALISSFRA